MKIQHELKDDVLHFKCSGKIEAYKHYLEFKKNLQCFLDSYPSVKILFVYFNTSNVTPPILGLLLKYINQNHYEVHCFICHYGCFKILKDLMLVEKLNAKYQKESQC